MTTILVPLPVVLPLATAAILLIFAPLWPRRVPDAIAIVVSLGVAAICWLLLRAAADAPLVYWFGGWQPRHGLVLGIGFVVGQTEALVALFIAALFAAAFCFAWGYYDPVRAHFHVLMLLLMAGMIGFCLTHDLFNMFVWFEVMSVSAFALTGYRLEASALEGALNFTVINGLGSYLMLAGIGFIYARAGQLDFSALAHAVAAAGSDPVITAAFCLVIVALLTKGAVVPFQFWLSDAHAVAPSPVSVIFSGGMVGVAIFGVGRLYWQVFAADPKAAFVMHHLVLGMGAASAIIGGLMCLWQRHMKRLLAFSTISHVGVMLVGLGLPSAAGTVGMLAYFLGHGLVKAAAFMVAGILLALCGGIDELGLRGRGRPFWPAGIALGLSGLLLAGLPVGIMGDGASLIGAAATAAGKRWVLFSMVLGSALTGAAVMRAAGRIFLGWGPTPGEEEHAPTEQEQESNRPLWLMVAPCLLLLAAAVAAGGVTDHFVRHAAAGLLHPNDAAVLGGAAWARPTAAVGRLPPDTDWFMPWIGVAAALFLTAWDLSRRWLPGRLRRVVRAMVWPVWAPLNRVHDGIVGDYIAWMVAGIAVLAVVLALG